MWIRKLVATSASAGLLLAPGLLAANPAQAHGTSKITVRISDPTPVAGQTFVLRGRFTLGGADAAGHTVKVQTYRNGHYRQIDGARVTTDSEGRYRVRLILLTRGVRDLRVAGVAGGHHSNTYHRFVVEVQPHR